MKFFRIRIRPKRAEKGIKIALEFSILTLHMSKSHSYAISWSDAKGDEKWGFLQLWIFDPSVRSEFASVWAPVFFNFVEVVDWHFEIAAFCEGNALDDDVVVAVAELEDRGRKEAQAFVQNGDQERQFLGIEVFVLFWDVFHFLKYVKNSRKRLKTVKIQVYHFDILDVLSFADI